MCDLGALAVVLKGIKQLYLLIVVHAVSNCAHVAAGATQYLVYEDVPFHHTLH